MEEKLTTSGAVEADGGATPDNNPNDTSTDQEQDREIVKTVSLKNHRRVLDDMHSFKKRAVGAEEELNAIKEERLRESEDWKQLSEKHKSDADKWKHDAESNKSLYENTQKYNAVKKQALSLGLLPEAIDDLDLLDLADVRIETTDAGRYRVEGAKDYAENLKKAKPYWFKKMQAPTIDGGGGNNIPNDGEMVTASDVNRAEDLWKLGKISRVKFEEVFNKYRHQKIGG